jgi:hypothetical protein
MLTFNGKTTVTIYSGVIVAYGYNKLLLTVPKSKNRFLGERFFDISSKNLLTSGVAFGNKPGKFLRM